MNQLLLSISKVPVLPTPNGKPVHLNASYHIGPRDFPSSSDGSDDYTAWKVPVYMRAASRKQTNKRESEKRRELIGCKVFIVILYSSIP